MLAPTLDTLPTEVLSHIFSYLVFKDITTLPPSQSLLPYYYTIIYRSVFIVKESTYDRFSAALVARPSLAKLIIKFDIDFRDEDFRWTVGILNLVIKIIKMSQLKWLGLGEVPRSVILFLLQVALNVKDFLPQLRHLNICEEYSTITTQSILNTFALVSQLPHLETLSIQIDNDEGDDSEPELWNFDTEDKEALSLLNFDHIISLDIKGELNQPLFTGLLQKFRNIQSLTLRSFDVLDLTPIIRFQYPHLEALHLLDASVLGNCQDRHLQVLQFTHLKELSIGDGTFFFLRYLPLLSNLSRLETLNLGAEIWNDTGNSHDLLRLLRSMKTQINSFRNLNLNTRFDYFKILPTGSRWKEKALEDSELQAWICDKRNSLGIAILQQKDLLKLFKFAKRNKIKIGGQILEVDWLELARARRLYEIRRLH